MKVLNKYIDKLKITADDIYIGRPSIWGNPFITGKDGTREQVIEKHKIWIKQNTYLLSRIHELKGKNLICFCAPKTCHGDILLELANK